VAREITHIRKDNSGDITDVKGTTWQENRATVVRHIDIGIHKYYVEQESPRADVHVYNVKFIRTNADSTSKNNLDNLPLF